MSIRSKKHWLVLSLVAVGLMNSESGAEDDVIFRGGSSEIDGDDPNRAWTHLRLNIFPDGGVARLRVYGEVMNLPGAPPFAVGW